LLEKFGRGIPRKNVGALNQQFLLGQIEDFFVIILTQGPNLLAAREIALAAIRWQFFAASFRTAGELCSDQAWYSTRRRWPPVCYALTSVYDIAWPAR
jgi:hypothetical protein